MKKIITLLAFLICYTGFSQDPNFLQITYIKPTPGENYSQIINENWSKLHQKRIDDGIISGWDVWWAMNSTSESDHQIVIVTLVENIEDFNNNPGIRSVFPDWSDEELEEFNQKNQAARTIIKTDLLAIKNRAAKQDSIPNVLVMNYMKVKPVNALAYEKMEDNYKNSNFENSNRASWGMAKRIDKYGTGLGWNYMTFDLYNNGAELMNSRVNTYEYPAELAKDFEIRDMVYSQTYVKWMALRKE